MVAVQAIIYESLVTILPDFVKICPLGVEFFIIYLKWESGSVN